MSRGSGKLVTIIGSGYCQPIADMLDRWLVRPRPRPNRVQSGDMESGYAASCVLLLVAMLESYVSRLRFARGATIPLKLRQATEIIDAAYPRFRYRKALLDVYVQRDLLIHNHLWEIDYEWGGTPPMIMRGATRNSAYGDKKYAQRVNLKTHRTKALRLTVLPSRVDRTDVLKVFRTVWKILLVFEATDRFQCYVSEVRVHFRGKTVLFSALQDMIENSF